MLLRAVSQLAVEYLEGTLRLDELWKVRGCLGYMNILEYAYDLGRDSESERRGVKT